MTRRLPLVGAVVPRTAPRRMVANEHFQLSYDQNTGEAVLENVVQPASAMPIGDYLVRAPGGDPDVAVPVDGPFPYRFPFTPSTHPKAWAGNDGLASWQAIFQVAARAQAPQVVGRFSEQTTVTIGETGTLSIQAENWSATEITDFTASGGVSGKFTISVVGGVAPPEGHELRVYAGSLAYVPGNYALIHDVAATTAVVLGTPMAVASGVGAGETVTIVLLWNVDGLWLQASENVLTPTVVGVVNPVLPSFSSGPTVSGTGKIGSALTVSFTAQDATLGTTIQWFASGQPISGATSSTYTPVAADDRKVVRARVTASNAFGSLERTSNGVTVTYVAPTASGSIADQTHDQEAGGSIEIDAAAQFTGQGLVFSIEDPQPLGFAGDYELLFEDDFDGSSLDLTKWRPNWLGANDAANTPPVSPGNDEAAYSPGQVTVSDGNCVLSAVATPITVGGDEYPNRSGMIQTFGKFTVVPQAGKPVVLEARINLEASSGSTIANFPAWWSAGTNWPANGEIDIVEGLSGNASGHFHYPGGGPGTSGAPGDDTGWHVWSAKWYYQDKIEYAKDGTVYGTITPRGTGYQLALSSAHYLILNLAVRSDVGGPDKVPGQMLIDYVRVWREV